jgi:AcrR family transcriptional regulator
MATAPKGTDRRVQRTRQGLKQAFLEVAREKGPSAATIQDITERANVSRGTFYAHFADKFALIDAIVREEFQRQVGSLPLASESPRNALHMIIRAALDYSRQIYQQHYLSSELTRLIERAIHEELERFMLGWLKAQKGTLSDPHISLELLAQVMSWAIFGAAIGWSREATPSSSERRARDVLLALTEAARLVSNESPGASS